MDCDQVRDVILEGGAASAEHLANCEACRAFAAQWSVMERTLSEAPTVRPGFETQLAQRIEAATAPAAPSEWLLRGIYALAGAALAITVGASVESAIVIVLALTTLESIVSDLARGDL